LIWFDEMVENFCALFYYKGNAPSEKVHKVWEQIGVWTFDKLLNIQCIILFQI